ncbi:flagellar basal body-associated FliL family protein [Rickettsiales bacterium]|nr:flagellar basal body-associated FliL family protein [Rickettsiales bacterium]
MADEEENQENEEDEDIEGDGDGDEGGAGAKKGGKKKIVIIVIILLLVLLGGGGAGLYFMGFFGTKKVAAVVAEGEEVPEVLVNEDGVVEEVVYYDMEEFVINLNVGSKTPTFLKMTVSLELPGESQIPGIEVKIPRIRDSFQVYLRELRRDDLQGSAGMYRLREELLLRINKTVYPFRVNDILFKEILVQ